MNIKSGYIQLSPSLLNISINLQYPVLTGIIIHLLGSSVKK